MTIQETMQLAVQHHQAGRLAEAEGLYRQILAREPHHADALHLLGVIAGQSGRVELAADLLRQAIAIMPGNPAFHANLASLLQGQGKLDPAILCYQQALALKPDFPEALYNLANAWTSKGRFDRAIDCYQRTLSLRPDFVQARNNLGNAHMHLGELDKAVAAYERVLALQPDYVEAHNNLGAAFWKKGWLDQAIACYERALALKPDYAEAHNNLGNAWTDKGQPDRAITCYGKALAFRPDYAEAYNNLGNAWKDKEQMDQAIACFRRALTLNPTYADACYNLGKAWTELGRLDEALLWYDRAIELRPDYAAARGNRVFIWLFHPSFDAAAIAAELGQWNRLHAEPLKQFIQPHHNDPAPDRRLRVGYVSADFRSHVVGRNILPLLRHHDREHFQVFAFSAVSIPDAFTARLRRHVDEWRDVGEVDDERAAALIRKEKIDILVDLSLHLAKNRLTLFARKPAPVQATFAGYPGSTGLEAIDYRLSDPYLDPPGMDESVYSERTIRLPHSFWCYDPEAMESAGYEVGPLPALQKGFVTFGCLNNFCKVNDAVLALWAEVLTASTNSRLLLMAPAGEARERVLERLGEKGIAAARVEFVGKQALAAYFRTYHGIDIGLDTFPYNGHTTSLDSLWMGVPVVTLVGKTVVGRAGWSQLNNLALSELAADTSEKFVAIAKGLATDLPRLSELRSTLRGKMLASPLTDGRGFARAIESAYRQMWRNWCEKK